MNFSVSSTLILTTRLIQAITNRVDTHHSTNILHLLKQTAAKRGLFIVYLLFGGTGIWKQEEIAEIRHRIAFYSRHCRHIRKHNPIIIQLIPVCTIKPKPHIVFRGGYIQRIRAILTQFTLRPIGRTDTVNLSHEIFCSDIDTLS